jgi:glycine amidinotransferase
MMTNVYTEWAALKEVVVGNCVNIDSMSVDDSFKLFFYENLKDQLIENSVQLQKKLIDQRQEDLDNFADTLIKHGVKVKRPKQLTKIQKFKTPEFEEFLCPVDNPRDQSLIIGNEIIETSCQWRRRYFENDLMKAIFLDYFKEGSKWTVAPKPSMSTNSFDFTHLPKDSDVDLGQYLADSKLFEIMFDGAQCLRFGKDIVMNVSTENHVLGAEWLQRHLGDKYKIHQVRITDHHIDGMFMPLRPGVLLLNPTTMKNKIDLLPKELQRWDHIVVPEPHKQESNMSSLGPTLASHNINVNVLSLNEKEVFVFDEHGSRDTPLITTLAKNGFEPIPIKLRHSRLFGGGLHCCTLDTIRDDKHEDFFS